jgi:hypothetical protein
MFNLDARGKRVLIISDLHHPWAVDDWFEFLKNLSDKRKYDIIISIGDEVDGHGISFHENELGMPTASKELEMAQECMMLMATLFPKMYILNSNHGSLIFRKAKFNGIPYAFLKPLNELYGTPLYEWHDEILLKTNQGRTYLCHGKSSAYGRLAINLGCNAIQGHFHSKAEITYHKTIFGMKYNAFVGCLADRDKLAFTYAKSNIPDFINSVMEIDRNGKPDLILYRPSKK